MNYANLLHRITLIGYVLILINFIFVNLTEDSGSWPRWVIQTLPLLILAPGLWQQRPRSYIWLCFVLLIYFTGYLLHVVGPKASLLGYGMLALVTGIFLSSMFTLKLRGKARREAEASEKSDTSLETATKQDAAAERSTEQVASTSTPSSAKDSHDEH